MPSTPSAPPAPPRTASVLALADDLSGAAEVAVALGRPGRILLKPSGVARTSVAQASACTVVDIDSRSLGPDEAAERVRHALARHAAPVMQGQHASSDQAPYGKFDQAQYEKYDHAPYEKHDQVLYKKIDSQLRGNLAAEAVAYVQDADGLLIAPALPVGGRTVRGGVVHVGGIPLHETAGWRAEGRPAPPSVAAALAGLDTVLVPLDVVREGHDALVAALAAVLVEGRHAIADAETDADLDALARAALAIGPRLRLLGSGGLAGALGRVLPGAEDIRDSTARNASSVLAVVGTAETTAAAQIAHLVGIGARHVSLSAAELLAGTAELPTDWPEGTLTALSITPAPAGRSAAPEVARALAARVASVPGRPDLVLTGGETARRVLDALGVTELRPAGEIHHGAVKSRTTDGRTVVTRPGSYGDEHSLLTIARALRPDGYRAVP
ncbi:four-carbon acid sugar kinase family protein [Streptomyces sp. BH105]|uniref:four-carbon acid sugar kinase family protein n=1 Tax=Streptomyces sp. BH105 TaxID=3410408 RepID=UPI003CF76033